MTQTIDQSLPFRLTSPRSTMPRTSRQTRRRRRSWRPTVELLESRCLLAGIVQLEFDTVSETGELSLPAPIADDGTCRSQEFSLELPNPFEAFTFDRGEMATTRPAACDPLAPAADELGDAGQQDGFRLDGAHEDAWLGPANSVELPMGSVAARESDPEPLDAETVAVPPAAAAPPLELQAQHVSRTTPDLLPTVSAPAPTPAPASVYFSGTTSLSPARWTASSDDLVEADALLDGGDSDDRESASAIAANAHSHRETAKGSAVSGAAGVLVGGANDRELAFAAVGSWKQTFELPSLMFDDPVGTSRDVVDATPLPAGDPPDTADVSSPETTPDMETFAGQPLPKARAGLALGRWPGRYLIGGMAMGQILLSVSSWRRKRDAQETA